MRGVRAHRLAVLLGVAIALPPVAAAEGLINPIGANRAGEDASPLLRPEPADRAAPSLPPGDPELAAEIGGLRATQLNRAADRITLAYEEGRYQDALALIEAEPEVLTVRPDISLVKAWSLHHLDRSREARPLFRSLYLARKDAASAEGFFYSAIASSGHKEIAGYAEEPGSPLAAFLAPGKPVVGASPPQDTRTLFYETWLGDAQARGSKAEASTAAEALGRALPETPPRAIAAPRASDVTTGWTELKAQRFGPALEAFGRARSDEKLSAKARGDAAFGYTLTLARSGRTIDAIDFASRNRTADPRIAPLERDLLLARGNGAFSREDYVAASAAFTQAEELGPLTLDQRTVHAWATLKAGRTGEAADRFKALYAERPDAATADGLIAAYSNSGRREELEAIAAERGGPLSEKLAATAPPPPLAASSVAPTVPPESEVARRDRLAALPVPTIDLSARFRSRDGDDGTSRLDHTTFGLAALAASGPNLLKAEIRLHYLDADGDPGPEVLVGRALLPAQRVFGVTTDETVYDVSLAWRREDRLTLGAEVGTSPIGGEVDATWTGALEARYALERGEAGLRLYRRAVEDSLLSFAGAKDPATGDGFGGVVETGAEISGHAEITSDWRADARLRVGERTGEKVEDNGFIDLTTSVTRAFDVPGFAYVSAGPQFQYMSFEDNLSEFTVGHGGYYSPQSFTNVGLGGHFLTEEGAGRLVRGSASLGYQTAEEDRAPVFPGAPNGQFYESEEADGIGIFAALQAAWLLTDNLIFETGGYYLDVEEYQEFAALAHLRLALSPREGLFRQDLSALLR